MKLIGSLLLILLVYACKEPFCDTCCYTCQSFTTVEYADTTVYRDGKVNIFCDISEAELDKLLMDSTHRYITNTRDGQSWKTTTIYQCYQ